MQTIEFIEVRGIELLDVLHAFTNPLKDEIWRRVSTHPIFEQLSSGEVEYTVVTGLWLRRLVGHAAVDCDQLSDFRRNWPPITDKDLIFIRRYE
jgi:hypothetical protein